VSAFAAGASPGGAYISIGSLVGASLFAMTVIIAKCIYTAQSPIKVDGFAWYRDLLFYIGALLIIFVYGIIGTINIYMAVAFFLTYVVYITLVMVHYCVVLKKPSENENIVGGNDNNKEVALGDENAIKKSEFERNSRKNVTELLKKFYTGSRRTIPNLNSPADIEKGKNGFDFRGNQNFETKTTMTEFGPQKMQPQDSVNMDMKTCDTADYGSDEMKQSGHTGSTAAMTREEIKVELSKIRRVKWGKNLSVGIPENQTGQAMTFDLSPSGKSVVSMAEMKSIFNKVATEVDSEKRNCLNIAYQVYETPFNFMRKYSIFPNMKEGLNTPWLPVYPLGATIGFYVLTGKYLELCDTKPVPIPTVFIAAICSLPLCFLVWLLQRRIKEKLLWVFLPLSLVMCILWLNAPAAQVVENLTFVAEHFQWNMVLLACTVLAMGNSLSDYYTDAGMAAIGYGVMAVTGAVSAQFFNFTFGWGLGLFRQILTKGDVEFDLFGMKNRQSPTATYACV